MPPDRGRSPSIVVVGSGGNGIAIASLLIRAGYDDLTIITKHDDFGGAWLQNNYPGCEVDNPSMLYQFEFQPNHAWSALYASQPELLAYMGQVAKKNLLYERTRFATEMLDASWSELTRTWEVQTSTGRFECNILILATGFLEEAVVPDIVGMETFEGEIFHSSQWPSGYSGAGDRVAVVGSGSSGIQIVAALQPVADQVLQFQRTPTFVLPKHNRRFSDTELDLIATSYEEREQRYAEALAAEEENWSAVFLGADKSRADEYSRESMDFLQRTVKEPALRAALTPTHQIGCKRPLVSDDYYFSLNCDNVDLVAEAVTGIQARSLVTDRGRRFAVDTIVLATGFYFGGHILDRVTRRDGRSVREHHAGHPRAYKAVSVSGCPNLFLVGGSAPNGQIWNGIFPGQAVAPYVISAIEHMRASGIDALEVREDDEIVWKAQADEILDLAPTVAGGCINYSQDEHGHNKAAWPGSLASMRETFSRFDHRAYDSV